MGTVIRAILGFATVLGGIAVGVYVGLWLMFVGGIVQIANSASEQPIDSNGIAWGAVRVVFATAAGEAIAVLLIFIGLAIVGLTPRLGRRRVRTPLREWR
ncbi:MAG: hypothetical protein HY475_03140 [Candidatus Terrybacteria bacterium]|nr:hypothetical protein [Candidatus Terrybacteria bacterium]